MDVNLYPLLMVALLVFLVWLAVRFFGGVSKGLTGEPLSSEARPCPRCGLDVEKGKLDRPQCQFDFRTIGAS